MSGGMSFPPSVQRVFFGGYGEAIHVAELDLASGALRRARVAAAQRSPAFLARGPGGRHLYAVQEGNSSALHAYLVEDDGLLRPLASVPSEGAWTCHLAAAPGGGFLVATNYVGGSAIVYRLRADGTPGERVGLFSPGHASGANPARQEAGHAHGVLWEADASRCLVTDLGADRVYSYQHDKAGGTLSPAAQPWVDLPAGTGPRQAKFSTDGAQLYVIGELANTVSRLVREPGGGAWRLADTVSLLADGEGRAAQAADLAVAADGRFVYASVRGINEVVIFAREPSQGALRRLGALPVPANPRHLALSPDGRWLLVAAVDADRVAVYAVDAANGSLAPTAQGLDLPKPSCVCF